MTGPGPGGEGHHVVDASWDQLAALSVARPWPGGTADGPWAFGRIFWKMNKVSGHFGENNQSVYRW